MIQGDIRAGSTKYKMHLTRYGHLDGINDSLYKSERIDCAIGGRAFRESQFRNSLKFTGVIWSWFYQVFFHMQLRQVGVKMGR